MPDRRINMCKIRGILRPCPETAYSHETGLSFRQISQYAGVSTGAIQKILKPPDASQQKPLTPGAYSGLTPGEAPLISNRWSTA